MWLKRRPAGAIGAPAAPQRFGRCWPIPALAVLALLVLDQPILRLAWRSRPATLAS